MTKRSITPVNRHQHSWGLVCLTHLKQTLHTIKGPGLWTSSHSTCLCLSNFLWLCLKDTKEIENSISTASVATDPFENLMGVVDPFPRKHTNASTKLGKNFMAVMALRKSMAHSWMSWSDGKKRTDSIGPVAHPPSTWDECPLQQSAKLQEGCTWSTEGERGHLPSQTNQLNNPDKQRNDRCCCGCPANPFTLPRICCHFLSRVLV